MEIISHELKDELNKVKLGLWDGNCKGVEVLSYRLDGNYGTYENGKPKKPGELKTISMLDLIAIICDPSYKDICAVRAGNVYRRKIDKIKDYTYKLKDGAYAVFPTLNYRYNINEANVVTNLCYKMHRGTVLYDGDFDIKKTNITLEKAKELVGIIMPKLYVKLKKYTWFVFIDQSTSGKGIHIYTHSQLPDLDIRSLDDKSDVNRLSWSGSKDDMSILDARCIKYFQLNYQYKLYFIYKELKEIWDELDLEKEQSLDSFFDSAMYKPTMPFNVTPMHKGNILLNENFKVEVDDDIYKWTLDEYITDIRDIRSLDEQFVDLVKINIDIKDDHTTQTDISTKFETILKIESKDYNLEKTKSKEGFYFGHNTRHKTKVGEIEVDTPLIKEVIHTMKCFYDDNEIEEIWKTDGFYNQDAEEANIISWIKNWKEFNDKNELIPKENYVPSKGVVMFLNEWCGFDIKYEDYTIYKQDIDAVDIKLTEKEWLGDYWPKIIKAIDNKPGIYLVKAPTGSGKTVTHVNINRKMNEDFMNMYMYRPVVITEPYNSISMSKFNDEDIEIIVGSKRFPNILTNSTMYATNYVHFDQLDIEDIKQFQYIIIDESHLITHEEFRSKQLISFIHKVNELSKHSIIILQTATPMDEYATFEIKRTFNLHKEDKRNITYRYIKFDNDDFDVTWTYSMIKDKLSHGIKTYVYMNNIGIRQAKAFASLFDGEYNVAIYHKRIIMKGEYTGSAMEVIDKTHMMGEYDLLISSVYFGVGNDLNDQVENACCFIIGNNPWQEDVQVFGRFRNAKNIEVITVCGGKMDDNAYNYDRLLHYKTKNGIWQYNDRTNRNKSDVVWTTLESKDDIKYWAIIKINKIYHASKIQKNMMLPLYVDDYDENIEEVEADTSMSEHIKEYYSELSKEDQKEKQNILQMLYDDKNSKIEYKNEPKFDRWIRCVKRLRYNITDDVFFSIVNSLRSYMIIHPTELFCIILSKYYDNKLDYGEIAAFEYYRKSEHTDDDMIHSYLIWYFFHNYDENSYELDSNWWFEFKWKCKNYSLIKQELIDFLYSDNKLTQKKLEISQLQSMEEVFGTDTFKTEIERIEQEMTFNYDPNGKFCLFRSTKMDVADIVNWILEHDKKIDSKHMLNEDDRKKSKRNSKIVIICDGFKNKEKYGLKAGQSFMSSTVLAQHCGVTKKTVSEWSNKQWIVKAI